MVQAPHSILAALLFASAWGRVAGSGAFLGAHRDYDIDFQSALASVMGCGGSAGEALQEHSDAIKRIVAPMWDALPKNQWGKVEWPMLRYAAHRYFMQQFSVLVSGLEPTTVVNDTSLVAADVLPGRGESILDAVLKGKVSGQGFSLDDITLLVATVERMILDTDAIRLEEAYAQNHFDVRDALSDRRLREAVSTYMAIWTNQGNTWKWRSFSVWVVKKMEFEASHRPRAGSGRAAMQQSFTFEDVHRAVRDITKGAASYWDSSCKQMKSRLVNLDKSGTGRVAISDFHGNKADGDARFSESEDYLRALGALDETSAQRGSQVIIPNYVQGASNCLAVTQQYMVCCETECEEVLNDIENAVGAPAAGVEAILGLVDLMVDFDNDEPPAVDGTLRRQLQHIAEIHDGQVPLHGRLFALWLHYVFPQECPYPRKPGTTIVTHISQFEAARASDEEVQGNSAQRDVTTEEIGDVEHAHRMSQWSEEMADLGTAPWEREGSWLYHAFAGTAMLAAAGSFLNNARSMMTASKHPTASSGSKPSFV